MVARWHLARAIYRLSYSVDTDLFTGECHDDRWKREAIPNSIHNRSARNWVRWFSNSHSAAKSRIIFKIQQKKKRKEIARLNFASWFFLVQFLQRPGSKAFFLIIASQFFQMKRCQPRLIWNYDYYPGIVGPEFPLPTNCQWQNVSNCVIRWNKGVKI